MTAAIETGPVSRLDPERACRRVTPAQPVRLKLDANEGPVPPVDLLLDRLRRTAPELIRRYPDASDLESVLAERFGVDPEQVLVTAGADEALDRCCRAFLSPERLMLLPMPAFEMLERYARLAGGGVVPVPWNPGPCPVHAMLAAVSPQVGIVAVTVPNNPTGEVTGPAALEQLAAAAPRALLLLDHAYAEYADQDLTSTALTLPNAVVVRTFSKAWGLAGCRVGYALGPARLIGLLRAAGGPYPVAGPSLALALAQLRLGAEAVTAHVARVRTERTSLAALLAAGGAVPRESQANFVFADFGDRAGAVQAALAAQGILVRGFPGRPGASTGLRITLPGSAAGFAELRRALERILPIQGAA